jgi:hypothetical protein
VATAPAAAGKNQTDSNQQDEQPVLSSSPHSYEAAHAKHQHGQEDLGAIP